MSPCLVPSRSPWLPLPDIQVFEDWFELELAPKPQVVLETEPVVPTLTQTETDEEAHARVKFVVQRHFCYAEQRAIGAYHGGVNEWMLEL